MTAAAIARLAWRNARYYWRYTLGGLATVGVSFVMLALFSLYMVDVVGLMKTTWGQRFMYGDVLVDKGGEDITLAEQEFLTAYLSVPKTEVQGFARFLYGKGAVTSGTARSIFVAKGYDLVAGKDLRGPTWAWDTVAGIPLHLSNGLDGAVIGRSFAGLIGCQLTPTADKLGGNGYPARVRPFSCPGPGIRLQAATREGALNSLDLSIVGVVDGMFREVDSRLVMLPLAALQRLLGTEAVSYYAIRLAHPGAAQGFIAALLAASAERKFQFIAVPWGEHRDADLYLRSLNYLEICRIYFLGIMLAVTGLALLATVTKLIGERTREIGTLQALGFRDADITAAFVGEILVTTAAGLGVGIILTLCAAVAVNALEIPYQLGGLTEVVQFRIGFDPLTFLELGAAMVAMTLIAAGGVMVFKLRSGPADLLIQ